MPCSKSLETLSGFIYLFNVFSVSLLKTLIPKILSMNLNYKASDFQR